MKGLFIKTVVVPSVLTFMGAGIGAIFGAGYVCGKASDAKDCIRKCKKAATEVKKVFSEENN